LIIEWQQRHTKGCIWYAFDNRVAAKAYQMQPLDKIL